MKRSGLWYALSALLSSQLVGCDLVEKIDRPQSPQRPSWQCRECFLGGRPGCPTCNQPVVQHRAAVESNDPREHLSVVIIGEHEHPQSTRVCIVLPEGFHKTGQLEGGELVCTRLRPGLPADELRLRISSNQDTFEATMQMETKPHRWLIYKTRTSHQAAAVDINLKFLIDDAISDSEVSAFGFREARSCIDSIYFECVPENI